MKKIVLSALFVLFGILCVCEANPIVLGVDPQKQFFSPTPSPSGPDYPAVLLSLAGIIFVESVILFGFLRDLRVFWACPYANAVSTIPGLLLFGVSGLKDSSPALIMVYIITGCFVVSVLIESGVIITMVKKLPLIRTLFSVFFANVVTYTLIVVFVPLNFFHFSL